MIRWSSPLLVLLVGCQVSLKVPSEALVECHADADCPAGWVCQATLKRCISPSAASGAAPTLVRPAVAPAAATSSVEITATFEVSGSLLATPEVRLELAGAAPFALRSADNGVYVFAYTPTGNEPQGIATVVATLTGATGQPSKLPVGNVALDFVAPELRTVAAVGNPVLAATSTGTVGFTVSEALGEAPTVTLGGVALVDTHAVTPPDYRFAYAVTPTAPQGAASVAIRVRDVAGNITGPLTFSVFTIDRTAPALDAAPELSPAAARPGQLVVVGVVTSEPLGDDPAFALVSGGTSLPLTVLDAVGGTRFTLGRQVQPADPEGTYTLALTHLADLAGNLGATATDLGTVVIDATAPAVTGLTFTKQVSKVSGFDTVSVTFSVTEAPPTAADLTVTVGTELATCQSTTPLAYHCTLPVSGTLEGPRPLSVAVADAAGNRGFAGGAVVYDFSPPQLVAAARTYAPGPGNLLSSVSQATTGSVVSVTVIPDEPLDLTAALGLTLDLGGTSLPGVLETSSLTTTSASFTVTVPVGATDGTYTPHVTWRDGVGNATSAGTFATPDIVVKTAAPVLVIDQSQVTYLRSPTGNGATEQVGGVTIAAGPLYQLAPTDPLSGNATIPAAAFTFSTGEPLRALVFHSTAGRQVQRGFHRRADTSADWPRIELSSQDSLQLFATGIDDAGNLSAPMAIASAEWVATPDAALGKTPHATLGSIDDPSVPTPRLPDERTVMDAQEHPEIFGADGAAWVGTSGLMWAQVLPASSPPQRTFYSLAHDPVRGRTTMFGGVNVPADTWEWNGSQWTLVSPVGGIAPPPRNAAAMAYDAKHGVVVLWGGRVAQTATYLDDMWTWDGAHWVQVDQGSVRPPRRAWHGLVYDSARERVVLVGGMSDLTTCTGYTYGRCGDTWDWDGQSWVERQALPQARYAHATAYDANRGVTVVFGGEVPGGSKGSDVWEWDGVSAWSQACLTAPCSTGSLPAARSFGRMAYDDARREVLLFGGTAQTANADCPDATWKTCGDTWAWTGTWTKKTPVSVPRARANHDMAYDANRREVVWFGGQIPSSTCSDCDETFAWNGEGWRPVDTRVELPVGRQSAAMSYLQAKQASYLYGGSVPLGKTCPNGTRYCSDLWQSTAAGWRQQAPASPPSSRYAMSFVEDRAGGRLLMFGGVDPSGLCAGGAVGNVCRDLMAFDGTTWSVLDTGTGPSYRHSYGAAYTATQFFEFGGVVSGVATNEAWTFTGATWANVTTNVTGGGSPPTARQGPAVTYDRGRGEVVMYGGLDSTLTRVGDTWVWNGAWTPKTVTGSTPGLRYASAMVYDAANGRVLLFGGDSVTNACVAGSPLCADVWEWNGAAGTWTALAPLGTLPTPRRAHQLAFAEPTKELLLFGGTDAASSVGYADSWRLRVDPGRRPALELVADLGQAGIAAAKVEGLRVRAHAGGAAYDVAGAAKAGASLWVWARGVAKDAGGAWVDLADNTVAPTGATLPAPPASALLASFTTAAAAARYVTGSKVYVKLTPAGTAAKTAALAEPTVAVDYVEVRVRYQAL